MKKIPTLFQRIYDGHKIVGITPIATPGMEWVMKGEGIATVKYDGACCAFIDGELYKRYDAKKGKKPPKGAIPCCDPDPVTGHWPHWVKCTADPADKWFWNAALKMPKLIKYREIITFEAVGPHFNGNPYGLEEDILIEHGTKIVVVERSFEGIRRWLEDHEEEGLVFWKDGEPQCKIKRTDFGLEWPIRKEKK